MELEYEDVLSLCVAAGWVRWRYGAKGGKEKSKSDDYAAFSKLEHDDSQNRNR